MTRLRGDAVRRPFDAVTAINTIVTAVAPSQTRLPCLAVQASVGGSSNSLLSRSTRFAAGLANISLHLSLPNHTGQALVHPSDRVLPGFANHAVVSSLVRLETWTAVLALLVSGSSGDVASLVVAHGALLSSRVGVATLVAADAASI